MLRNSAINLMLKVGLALSSIVFAIVSFTRASDILTYYPNFIISIFGDLLTLAIGAIVSIFLAVWVLSRKHKFASAFTYMLIIGIGMLINITSLTFLAVTWPLFCIAGALSLRYYPRIRVIIPGKNGQEKMKIVPVITIDPVEAEGGDTLDTKDELSIKIEKNTTSSKTTPNTFNIDNRDTAEKYSESPEIETLDESDNDQTIEYGKEIPFTEQIPNSDEDHHYSPLSTLGTIYKNQLDLDGEDENSADTFVPAKSEYEASQFSIEKSEVSTPELTGMVELYDISEPTTASSDTTKDKREYIISPFSSEHIRSAAEKAANDLRALKPKRIRKPRATTIAIDDLPEAGNISDIKTEIKREIAHPKVTKIKVTRKSAIKVTHKVHSRAKISAPEVKIKKTSIKKKVTKTDKTVDIAE